MWTFLCRKFGVNVETISQGKNADAFSPFSEFSDEQIAAVNRTIDDVYSGFIERVRFCNCQHQSATEPLLLFETMDNE